MEIELHHLRAFVVVAEERHFGRAAKRLYIAQPPLSQKIQRLEAAIGARLLDRGSRPIEPTQAGLVLLQEARKALEQADRAVQRTCRAASGDLGSLAIGAIPSSYNGLLPLVVREFRTRYPEVSLELHTMTTARVVAALRDRTIDVALARDPVDERDLVTMALIDEPLIAIVPEDHRFATLLKVAVEALDGEALILFPRADWPEFFDALMAMLERHAITPRVSQVAPDLHGQLGLVAAGLGITLHQSSVSTLDRRGLAFVPLAGEVPVAREIAVWRRGEEWAVLDRFLETTREIADSSAERFGGRSVTERRAMR